MKNFCSMPSPIYCLRSRDSTVIEQNDSCRKRCGDMVGKACSKGCMVYATSGESPVERLGLKYIDGQYYDLLFLKQPEHEASILSPIPIEIVLNKLSPREREVLEMKAKGQMSLTEIANALFISRDTVKTHINNIKKKLERKSE